MVTGATSADQTSLTAKNLYATVTDHKFADRMWLYWSVPCAKLNIGRRSRREDPQSQNMLTRPWGTSCKAICYWSFDNFGMLSLHFLSCSHWELWSPKLAARNFIFHFSRFLPLSRYISLSAKNVPRKPQKFMVDVKCKKEAMMLTPLKSTFRLSSQYHNFTAMSLFATRESWGVAFSNWGNTRGKQFHLYAFALIIFYGNLWVESVVSNPLSGR